MCRGALLVFVTLLLIIILLFGFSSCYWKSSTCCKGNDGTLANVGVTPAGMVICQGKLFVANNNNYGIEGEDSVTVIDLSTNLPITKIQHPSFNQPYTITSDYCCQYLYVTNSAGSTVTKIDAGALNVVDVLEGFDGPSGFVLSENGKLAFVNNYGATPGLGSGNGHSISVYDLTTNEIIKQIDTDLAPAAMAISYPKSQLVVVNYVDGNPGTGTLQVINTNNLTVTDASTVTGLSGPFDVVLSPNGCVAYVANFGSNNFFPFGTTVSIVDLVAHKIVWNVTTGIQPSGLALAGCYLYVTNYNTLYSDPEFSQLVPGQGTVSVIKLDGCGLHGELICPTFAAGQSPANILYCNHKLYVSNYSSNTISILPAIAP